MEVRLELLRPWKQWQDVPTIIALPPGVAEALVNRPGTGRNITTPERANAVRVVLPYSQVRTSDPAASAIKLADVKSDLRIAHNEDDGELTDLIDAAIARVETDTRRSLITQTWQRKYDCWPCFPLALDKPPLSSVTSIAYVDADGNSQTYASSNYTVDTARDPGVIHLNDDATALPSLDDNANNVTITWVSGFGADQSSVPQRYKFAIKLAVEEMYRGCDRAETYDRIVGQLCWGGYP